MNSTAGCTSQVKPNLAFLRKMGRNPRPNQQLKLIGVAILVLEASEYLAGTPPAACLTVRLITAEVHG